MGIPKKKSRPVEVDGKAFRFMVKETHIPDHPDQSEITVTVQEDAEKPGGVLQFKLPLGFPVGPNGVRDVVRQAIKKGWQPQTRGAPYLLEGFQYP